MDLSIAHCRSASTRARWSDNVEKRVVLTEIPPEHKAFIESMDMFFLSTIDHQGRPTVSYKGVSNENKKTNGGFSESGAIAAKHARYSWGERWRNNALFATLARISHTTECIGVANQRKPLCRNNSSSIRGAPRCRQSVARISLDLNLLKAARW
jgi:hypothetical protein